MAATAQSLHSEPARLLPVLAAVPDPRARRGVRDRLAVIVGLALCAVLAGARSFTAIADPAGPPSTRLNHRSSREDIRCRPSRRRCRA